MDRARCMAVPLALATAAGWAFQALGQAPPPQGWQFRCPAAGTVVELSGGGSLGFRGRDSSDPLVCLAGNDSRLFLSYWLAGGDVIRAGRRDLGTLFPAAPGKQVRYQYTTPDPRTQLSNTIVATWRVVETGPVQVPGGTFDAVRIERHAESVGTTWRQRETVWLDRVTGAPVKVDIDFAGGVASANLRSWQATRVRVPN